MPPLISIIIPARNAEATLAVCLEELIADDRQEIEHHPCTPPHSFAKEGKGSGDSASYAEGRGNENHVSKSGESEGRFSIEVIVVDDASEDGTADIAGKFPCRVITLPVHSGAAKARNAGASQAKGEILFFTDADCVFTPGLLGLILNSIKDVNEEIVLGGTYTELSYDRRFFSDFQSLFINYSETKHADNPDYVASHAMAMPARLFREHGGFRDNRLPIVEDVEFSHRLRRSGARLRIDPEMKVGHIFNFNLFRSLKNAFRKSRYWVVYSIGNRDLFADSGTASIELKADVAALILSLLLLAQGGFGYLNFIAALQALNIYISRGILSSFFRAGGKLFGLGSALYYLTLYPLAVGAGAFAGVVEYLLGERRSAQG
ncbi:MAG: glycosyltransferase [Nitrospinota bacterium]|nr:glycosyltransferase [Nitrospinota bacterium]